MIDLFYSLKAPYRKNAVWVLNDATVKQIRKLKDTTGQYLWQPSLVAGTPDTILGRPVKTSAFMPTAAAGAKTIAFGDSSITGLQTVRAEPSRSCPSFMLRMVRWDSWELRESMVSLSFLRLSRFFSRRVVLHPK